MIVGFARIWRRRRPLWFRPSAIAVGFVAGQYVEQWLRTSHPF